MKKITFLVVTLLMLCGASAVRASDICKDSTECANGYLCLNGHCIRVQTTVIPTTVPTAAPTAKPAGCTNNSTCRYGASDCVALGYTKGTGTCSGGVCCGPAPTAIPEIGQCFGTCSTGGVNKCVSGKQYVCDNSCWRLTAICLNGCSGSYCASSTGSTVGIVSPTAVLTKDGTSTIEGCVVGSDGDGDGEITLSDFAVWKYEYMSSVMDKGDYNCDGKLSITDYKVWKKAFLTIRNLTVTEGE